MVSSGRVLDVDFAVTGQTGSEYWRIRIKREGSERLIHIGYIMRVSPHKEEWVGFLRSPNNPPVVIPGITLVDVKTRVTTLLKMA